MKQNIFLVMGVVLALACSQREGLHAENEAKGKRMNETPVKDDQEISQEDKVFLIKLARRAIISHLEGNGPVEVEEAKLTSYLRSIKGGFVTLEINHRLRGCIGTIMGREPLWRCVRGNAINAAVHDPRFRPLTLGELGRVEIEISVLTPPQPLKFSSPEDLLAKITPHKDGLYLTTPYGSSTYLPQVWEQIQDKELFLSHLSEKHGAPRTAWREAGAKVEVYRALVFNERELGLGP